MTERMTRKENWEYMERVLKSGEVAEKGHVAALDLDDSGKLRIMAADTNLLAIGYFEQSFTGDGVKKMQIRLFKELTLHRFANDGTSALTDADVGTICSFKDSGTVSADATGRSAAGRVWAVTSAGVLVEMLEELDENAISTSNLVPLTVQLADVSTASEAYVASPVAGKIEKIVSVLGGAISGANSAVTTEINNVAITNGGFTVTQSGSAAGDVDSATPTANNTVAVGDAISVVTDGASTGTATLTVTFLVRVQ